MSYFLYFFKVNFIFYTRYVSINFCFLIIFKLFFYKYKKSF